MRVQRPCIYHAIRYAARQVIKAVDMGVEIAAGAASGRI
jgi:hypothetical protein